MRKINTHPAQNRNTFLCPLRKLCWLLACIYAGSPLQAQNCSPATAFDYLDINNVKARINNGGDMWWDLNSLEKYIVPKASNISAMGAGALWIGGVDTLGVLHMAAQTYRQNGNDFFPGPLTGSGTVNEQTCSDFDRIWKVNKSTIDSFTSGLFTSTPPSIAQWPGKGNPNLSFLPFQDLAPFVDVNGDFLYHPDDGDYPAIPGDQALWFVFNDAGNTHTETGGAKLGIEVQVLAYAYADNGTCLGTTTFYHYRIENKSSNNYLALYTAIWTDAHLGCDADDYIGCDTAHNIAIIYNADSIDGPGCTGPDYNANLPVAAVQILKGPVGNDTVIHYMDFFMVYNNDFSVYGNPEEADDYHNYMKAVYKNDTHLKNPLTNEYADYILPSDPSDSSGWSMCALDAPYGDLRMVVSSGPIAFEHHEVQTFDVAVVWDSTSVYPCPSYSNIINASQCVKDFFDGQVIFTNNPETITQSNAEKVFPNPAANGSPVQFNFSNAEQLEIYDITGRRLVNEDVHNKTSFHLNSDLLGKGIFIYRIHLIGNKIQSGKLVIE